MPYGMYVSAAGAEVQNRRVQILAHNLANVDTPGFKRELAVVQARHSEAIERGLDFQGSRSINDVGGGVELAATATEFSRGALRPTGNPADLALESDAGFFVIERQGQQLLTRAGTFAFSPDGQLRTHLGDAVLGEDGPIQIDPSQPWSISARGEVRQGTAVVGRLRIEHPASLGDLAKVGTNCFASLAPTQPIDTTQRRVVSGFLEMSAVNPALETMELIEASRGYEANVRMIQHQDQMLGSLVTRVLRQN